MEFGDQSLPLWGGAPRSESAIPMIASGNHTSVRYGGRALARSEEVPSVSPKFGCVSKMVLPSSAPCGGTFPKGEGIGIAKFHFTALLSLSDNYFYMEWEK